jgi:hypothetical protein
MGHSVVSPSGAERFFNCPGSVQAQAKIDVIEPSNPAALEGLAIHELAAICLKEDADPYDKIGEIVEVKDNYQEVHEYTVNDDFAFAVRMYRNTILGILEEHGLDRKALQVEMSFKLPEIHAKAKGTTDCSFVASDTLYVLDLKGGRGIIINPKENKQCLYYALRPYLDAKMFIKHVVIGIIQPRAKSGEYIKMWETTPARLEEFIIELKRAIALTEVKKPDFTTGEWCRFCRAQGNCASLQKGLVTTIQNAIPQIDRVFPKVTELTPLQIGNALPALEVLKGFIANLEGYALSLASNGAEIPNYVLTKSKKQRRYKDDQAVVDRYEQKLGEDLYGERKLRTPAQLEKIVGKEELSDFIFVPEGDLKLVPTKEAKEFISRKIEDVFPVIE